MEIRVDRFSKNKESTIGLMFLEGVFACYTIEDEKRNVKLKGETRIDEGRYEIKFRKEGSHHDKYGKRFKNIHKGMLELQDVPKFKYILIHIGNTDKDTDGCILIGDSPNNNKVEKGFVGASTQAYIRIYPVIAESLEKGEKVFITIRDIEV